MSRKVEYDAILDETPGGIEYISVRELVMDGNFVQEENEIGICFFDGELHDIQYYLDNMLIVRR